MASSASLTTTHLPALRAQLEEWRQSQPAPAPFPTPLADITNRALQGEVQGKDVIVAFRTRPPLPGEAEEKFQAYESKNEGEPEGNGENAPEDAAKAEGPQFCAGITVTRAEPGAVVVHVPGYKWSGPTLAHKTFAADLAFGPDVDNEEVYQRTVAANDMIELALSGGTACILAYGQTGAGKTHTMEGLEVRVARDLFVTAERVAARLSTASSDPSPLAGTASESQLASAKGGDVFAFNVTFLELLGKRAVDLLEPADGLPVDAAGNPVRKEVAVHEDKNGDVRPRLISRAVESSEELRELITNALAHRRTSATLRNATSSRSHALLTITITNKLLPYAEAGQIILVDLAGSERYDDSKAHDRARMAESRENNNSLMNLKECVRAKAKMAQEDGFVHVPWRGNKLTMLLKPIFDPEHRQPSKTLVLAHASPHIQDAAHSASTLGYAAPFRTAPPKPRGPAPYNAEDPRTWDHAQTRAWLREEFGRRARARAVHHQKVQEQKARQVGTGTGKGKGKGAAGAKRETEAKEEEGEEVQLAVNVEILCPEGMTAKHYGAMYTTEFVQRCLEARNAANKDARPGVVRNTAAEVVGRLYYLILTAKHKTRKEIMKSRKVLTLEAYGATPFETIPGTNERMPDLTIPSCHALQAYTHDQFRAAAAAHGSAWYEKTNAAVLQAREAGSDVEEARIAAIVGLMEDFRLGKVGGAA